MRKHTMIDGQLVDDETQETAREISQWVNSFATKTNKRQMAIYFSNYEHRTLQQSFAGFVQMWIEEQAKNADENRHDLRNEATVRWCKKIMDQVGLDPLPFI